MGTEDNSNTYLLNGLQYKKRGWKSAIHSVGQEASVVHELVGYQALATAYK
jgi:hypothetical protein